MNLNYSNFDLEFYRADENYAVKARSFAGEATYKFTLPFSKNDSGKTLEKIENSIIGYKQDLDFTKNFGEQLFEAVFQNDVRAVLKSSMDLVEADEAKGLRLRLHLQDISELSHLPWEFLYQRSTNQFFCLNRSTPMVRYIDIPKIIASLKIKLPLKILVMISSPTSLAQLNVDEERKKLTQAIYDLEKKGLIEIRFFENATVLELQKLLRQSQYHIFHYIGHGGFDETDNKGMLAFESEDGSVDYINAEQLAAILINHKTIRLVVLNSCEGAKTSIQNPFAGTAATLVQQGIPAVVAMQFIISDTNAIRFTNVFYKSLADGLPVDSAVTESRVAIFADEDTVEWATPVLFMRSSDGSLFKFKKDGTGEHKFTEKLPSRKRLVFYLSATIIFSIILFLILLVLPKSTVMEIDVFAKQVGFTMPTENTEQEVSLLSSGMMTNKISVENFQPMELVIDPVNFHITGSQFQNPLIIVPDQLNSRVTFSDSNFRISFQDILCDSVGKVNIRYEDENIYYEIQDSRRPYQKMSFGDSIAISVQQCTVKDGAGHDLTPLFSDPVTTMLPDLSKFLKLVGANGKLATEAVRENIDENIPLMRDQIVVDLNFEKRIFQNNGTVTRSTIDSIFVKRNFPLDNISLKATNEGELEMMASPNRFLIYDVSLHPGCLRIVVQGRLTSFKIGRGALMTELVPGYLSFITKNPLTSLLITFLGWLISLIAPYLYDYKFKKDRIGNG